MDPVWLLGLPALALGSYAVLESYWLELTRHILVFPGLPAGLEGFTILHLSDLHVGWIGRRERWLRGVLDAKEPDLLVLTGDLVSSAAGIPAAMELLGSIRYRHGAFFINGNNEVEELEDLSVLHRPLQALGFTVLVNANREIDVAGTRLSILGVDDPKNDRDDLGASLEGTTEGAFRILLSHTPETFEEAAGRGIPLVLCGHTHGGQVRVPGVGALWTDTPRTGLRYSAGLYRRDRTTMLVSRGMGWSLLPVRFNCRPEVIEITLTRGAT